MSEKELDLWWSHLTVNEKLRISNKINKDLHVSNPTESTEVWLSMSKDKKEFIHDHCTKKHGTVIPDWNEGLTMSY